MKKNYGIFIFDWDGTLMDTTKNIVKGMQYACRKLGFAVVSDKDANSIIGLSPTVALPLIIPELKNNPHLFSAYNDAYLEYQQQITMDELFPQTVQLLDVLIKQKTILAIATGRNRSGLDQMLDYYKLHDYFEITKTVSECNSKPHPQMIEDILDYTGFKPNEALMVGDTTHDVFMAHNAKVDSVALNQGAHGYDDLIESKPTYLYSSLDDLYHIINNRK